MTIKFFLQSNTNPASIYVRIREGKHIDAKANTGFLVNPDAFNKGDIKLFRINPKATGENKITIQEQNNYLNELQAKLDNLRNHISNLLNNKKDYEIIDSKWLKAVLNPSNEDDSLPSNLLDYFGKYLEYKKASLAASTIKKLKSIKARIERFENEKGRVFIQNVDTKFSKKFQLWMDDQGYDHNTKVKTLKVIKTVCNHASENGIPINPQLKNVVKELRYKKSEHIHLSFEEINQIIATDFDDEKLDYAKDWLIISCYTAQRVSDFLRFSKENIVQMEGNEFLDIRQNKTDAPVYIPLMPEVKSILKKEMVIFLRSFRPT